MLKHDDSIQLNSTIVFKKMRLESHFELANTRALAHCDGQTTDAVTS